MDDLFSSKKAYLKKVKERGQNPRIHYSHQYIGLEIATLLSDLKHKSLYIKLAKEYGAEKLLALAKNVCERRDIQQPGAYFMTLLKNLKKIPNKN